MCHANVNVKLMEEIVVQINGGIMANFDVSVKSFMRKKLYWESYYMYLQKW